MNKFIPQPVYACSSCGGGKITNTSVQSINIANVQTQPSQVRTIKSAPVPVVGGVPRRTI
jgi:hypothetical protein